MARVLVIDDHTEIRELLRLTLQAAGYDVVVAPNGREGLEMHREWPAELVITDMPDNPKRQGSRESKIVLAFPFDELLLEAFALDGEGVELFLRVFRFPATRGQRSLQRFFLSFLAGVMVGRGVDATAGEVQAARALPVQEEKVVA